MQLRCPYPETRELPWFGRLVEPDEVVDIPDELVENFLAAGWKTPDEPVVWPPEPPAPPADAAPPDPEPAAPSTPADTATEPLVDESAAQDLGTDASPDEQAAADTKGTTTSKKAR